MSGEAAVAFDLRAFLKKKLGTDIRKFRSRIY